MKKAADTIIGCLKKKRISQSQLANSMGEDVRNLNQQLRRQKDIKAGRFSDILEHIGYRIEVVDNNGIRKVCKEYAEQVIETGEPKGLFWFSDGDIYVAVDSTKPEVLTKHCRSKKECLEWFGYFSGDGRRDCDGWI